MPGAVSNAIATVTIQDQDLITPGLQNLVQRLATTVIFPSTNGLLYSGYTQVTLTTFTQILPAGAFSPFVYVRNASTSGQNALTVEYQVSGGPTASLNLSPGGIFLFANSIASLSPAPVNVMIVVALAVFAGSPVTAEYLLAY
jgi:hypothetical protein